MQDKKKATDLMNKATDSASDALEGVSYQNSDSVTEQYNNKIDKASELASAKFTQKNK